MRYGSRLPPTAGLTLIELLVALSLFALLGLLTWQATDHLTQARTHIGGELSRWRAIALAMHRIESEITQAVPGADGLQYFADGAVPAAALGEPGGTADPLAAAVWSLPPQGAPGRGPGAAVALLPPRAALLFSSTASADDAPGRMAFVLAGENLEWWLWPAPDAVEAPERVVLLERVRTMRWRFLHRGDWLDAWPPETSAVRVLPTAVAIDLELADAGNLVRILALR